MVNQSLTSVIENAKLNILAYDVHYREAMEHRNRMLNCYVVSYIKEGTCRLRIFNKDYFAKAGDVVLIPPNVIHDHIKDTHETTVFMWWHFTYKIADLLDVLGMFEFPLCFKLPEAQKFEEIFSNYILYAKQPRSISDIIMKEAKALEMLALILESAIHYNLNNCNGEFNNLFIQILIDIVKNPEKKYYLKELSEKYHLHPTYISNQFKKMFGVPPIELQKEIKLNKAKKLLQIENHSITEVARIVGYSDVDDFTRFFKNKTGNSPLKFSKLFTNSYKDESIQSILESL